MPTNRSLEKRFRATIDGKDKGRVYIPLPFDPASEWGTRGRYYVAGTINSMKFHGRPDDSGKGHFLPVGPAWRRDNGLKVGHALDAVAVRILDENPPREGLAADISAALDVEPGAGEFFDALAGFYRKNYLRWIDATERRPDVRAARIVELVELLKGGHKQRPR